MTKRAPHFKKRTPPSSPGQQAGIGLIEILVAVLILAIGILGVASTQVVSMQMNAQSQSRSQAVLLAEDLLDRIRANPNNPGGYALAQGAANNGQCVTGFVPGTGNVTNDDLQSWDNSLACMLPAAQRAVAVNGNIVTVTIDWDQDDPDANPVIVRTEI